MNKASAKEYALVLGWEETLSFLFDLTEKYPKKVRQSLTARTESLSLHILESFIKAEDPKFCQSSLELAFIDMEKLRFLLRFAYQRRFISIRAYENSMTKLQCSKEAIESRLEGNIRKGSRK
jgi:hypothetical protein